MRRSLIIGLEFPAPDPGHESTGTSSSHYGTHWGEPDTYADSSDSTGLFEGPYPFLHKKQGYYRRRVPQNFNIASAKQRLLEEMTRSRLEMLYTVPGDVAAGLMSGEENGLRLVAAESFGNTEQRERGPRGALESGELENDLSQGYHEGHRTALDQLNSPSIQGCDRHSDSRTRDICTEHDMSCISCLETERLAMQELRQAFDPSEDLPEDEEAFLAFVAQRIRDLSGHRKVASARL
ncbi:hypothetical protein SISSUDRAFT_1051048 [Sistotremastrum suecicum HHB10207 ss-3]|uniref:Uncharacterized protein n=1 Tax=Sistotremastrum suecicum HHB10207 ss-3 TaxID=1314776 RepID=A0A166AUN2_9AGAM|nr:hypothetical protein SISSUDRAFT_1051048 [Sistotremastrum suecicum HHB10207 ss-3]